MDYDISFSQSTTLEKAESFEKHLHIKLVTLFLLAIALAACSQPGSSSSDSGLASLSASATVPTALTPTVSTPEALVQCDHATGGSGDYVENLAAYMVNGVAQYQYEFLRFTQLPLNFATNGSYFGSYRWMGTSATTTYLDPTLLKYTIIDPNTGNVLQSNMTYIRWLDVQGIATAMGYLDPVSFFSHVWIVVDLRDTAGQYEAMLTVLYSSAGAEIERNNILLPIYNADPAGYAVRPDGTARNQTLESLHPFAGQTGLSVSAYQTMANSLCAPFQ